MRAPWPALITPPHSGFCAGSFRSADRFHFDSARFAEPYGEAVPFHEYLHRVSQGGVAFHAQHGPFRNAHVKKTAPQAQGSLVLYAHDTGDIAHIQIVQRCRHLIFTTPAYFSRHAFLGSGAVLIRSVFGRALAALGFRQEASITGATGWFPAAKRPHQVHGKCHRRHRDDAANQQ